MARAMTIDQLLESVPMGGVIAVYAPIDSVIGRVAERNSAMQGEWFSVSGITDKKGNIAVVIHRKELWNIVSPGHLLQEQHRWQNMDNIWRM